jgi:hypothetical protein
VEVEGDSECQVERVEDSRVYRNQLQYLVRWTGYDQMAWEPARDIDGLEAIDVFHKKYDQKPGSLKSCRRTSKLGGGYCYGPEIWIGGRLHSLRYMGRCAGTREMKFTH